MAVEARLLVKGMGAGMRVLELLMEEIKAHGGDEEILAFMTRPRFRRNLKEIVEFMVTRDWRIPASEMRKMALKAYCRDFEAQRIYLKTAENLWWYAPLRDLCIPYRRFTDDPMSGDPPIPPRLREALHGRRMEYPLVVGDEIVVDLDLEMAGVFELGDTIDAHLLCRVSLADKKYFDFDR